MVMLFQSGSLSSAPCWRSKSARSVGDPGDGPLALSTGVRRPGALKPGGENPSRGSPILGADAEELFEINFLIMSKGVSPWLLRTLGSALWVSRSSKMSPLAGRMAAQCNGE